MVIYHLKSWDLFAEVARLKTGGCICSLYREGRFFCLAEVPLPLLPFSFHMYAGSVRAVEQLLCLARCGQIIFQEIFN